ncbi:hypothetical protein JAO78_004945 [Alishewanella sp. 16-MA]|uniref:Uncharacterized protein n=1 Tax=Alishewanella maricola TaxID=2795740 RepID=A0ABS8C1F4_9ALTE|nr:hypothetical protein [Alishewanella maricola]MCB5226157.1 hypothetical protein [Alishewanella maricola]
MKWIMLVLLVIAAAFYLTPVTVNGSIYVVTNARETVNMPLTEVRAFDREQFLKEWNNQSTQRLNMNCGIGPTEVEMSKLDLQRLREGPNKVPNWREMNEIYKACSFGALIWENPRFQPIANMITDKNGDFSFKVNRFKDVIIFSKGSRKVIGDEENYVWLHKMPAKTLVLSQKIELHNMHQVHGLRTVDYSIN